LKAVERGEGGVGIVAVGRVKGIIQREGLRGIQHLAGFNGLSGLYRLAELKGLSGSKQLARVKG